MFGPSYPQIDPLSINEQGVKKLLSGINPNKALGPDQIPCRLLKDLCEELAPVYTALFRQSLTSGDLPSRWTLVWIALVFMKRQRNPSENYRPVSLACVSCKLLGHILCAHIHHHLDMHGILTPYNHGFCEKHSCESQLLVTTHDMCKLDTGSQVHVAVLDFSKAFNTVPHGRLLRKLKHCGTNGPISIWIKTSCVTWNRVSW